MKKVYSKPQIVFDSFELSQSIAAGCATISNQAWQVCPVDIGLPNGKTIFAQTTCQISAPGQQNLVCYDIPAPDSKVFSS